VSLTLGCMDPRAKSRREGAPPILTIIIDLSGRCRLVPIVSVHACVDIWRQPRSMQIKNTAANFLSQRSAIGIKP